MIPENYIRALARLSEAHPYTWKIAWTMAHRMPFLLPHDRSYYALPYLVKAAPNGLFLDVGANDGISVLSFRRFDRSYSILSLEPNRLLEPALRELKNKDANFDYKMVGAGLAPGEISFYVPKYRSVVVHTLASGRAAQVMTGMTEVFGPSIANKTRIEAIRGTIVRIDDLHVDPTIVKVDTEGFDYDVLLGMEATIARMRPFIMIEIAWANRDKIIEFFDARSYSMLAYDNAHHAFSYDLGQESRNYFAIPRERVGDVPILAECPDRARMKKPT
jgi:FkbM family methyltransferase